MDPVGKDDGCVRRANCVLRVAVKRSCRCDFEITSGEVNAFREDGTVNLVKVGVEPEKNNRREAVTGVVCSKSRPQGGGLGRAVYSGWAESMLLVRCCVFFAKQLQRGCCCDFVSPGRFCAAVTVCYLGDSAPFLYVTWAILRRDCVSPERCCVIFAGDVGYAMLCDLRWER